MKFSIITPSYNGAKFLRDCLESVRRQVEIMEERAADGRFTVEHIVIDGASTDGTLDILKQWKAAVGSRYSFEYVSEPDSGMTEAINKGFARASGDWLMWLNADDWLLDGALEAVAKFAAKRPDADVVYGDINFVDEAGRLLREKREFDFDRNLLLFYGCYIPSTACFYRRRIVDSGLLLDPQIKICMDFEWFLKLDYSGFHFAHLREILAAFRWHGSNLSDRQAVLRGEERLLLQRRFMELRGARLPQSRLFLRLVFYAYRAARLIKRKTGFFPAWP